MFGCAHDLFQLIPAVCELGSQRREEQYCSTGSKNTTLEYSLLEAKIQHWQPSMERCSGVEFPNQLLVAGRIYQYALLTFLHATYHGSNVKNPTLLEKVDTLILKLFHLMKEGKWREFGQPEKVPAIATTLLWPYIIMGSCMRHQGHQNHLRSALLRSSFQMTIVQRAVQLLDWVWADPSEYAYGPYGLEIVMKKHNMNICMA